MYIGVGDDYYDAQGNQGAVASATFTVDADADLPAFSVGDATVHEGQSAELAFTVSLDRTVAVGDGAVSVDYATRDVTAYAGADYTAASGTLTFAVGEQRKTVNVAVLEDSHDDDGETLDLVLSNAVGATIADGTGRGTIRNSDPMPKAWLGRFGRSMAEQVLEGVRERREAVRNPGERAATIGGHEVAVLGGDLGDGVDADAFNESDFFNGARSRSSLDSCDGASIGISAGAEFNRRPGTGVDGAQGSGLAAMQGAALRDSGYGGMPEAGCAQSQSMTMRDLLLGTSIAFTGREDEAGGTLSAWGRMSESSFSGTADALSSDGELSTSFFGWTTPATAGWPASRCRTPMSGAATEASRRASAGSERR